MSQYQYTQRATENDLIQYQFHSLYQMGKQSLQEEKEDVNFPITYHFPNGDVKVYSQQLKFDRANYVIELNTKDGHRRTLTLHVPRNSH
ncbi:hypothetical protein [Gracilibacillus halophilus]|nr:hypothetical protein [Gracilibacillus halophilus]